MTCSFPLYYFIIMGGGKKPPVGSVSLRSPAPQLLGTAAKTAAARRAANAAAAHDDAGDKTAETEPTTANSNEETPAVEAEEQRPEEPEHAPPPLPEGADPSLAAAATRTRYECRRCRLPLFVSDELLSHSDDATARGHKSFLTKKYAVQDLTSSCSSLFLDPEQTAWVAEQANVGGNSGDLVCPNAKCSMKLGSWSWVGSQCSCGQWVNPSFKVVASKLDAFAVEEDQDDKTKRKEEQAVEDAAAAA